MTNDIEKIVTLVVNTAAANVGFYKHNENVTYGYVIDRGTNKLSSF